MQVCKVDIFYYIYTYFELWSVTNIQTSVFGISRMALELIIIACRSEERAKKNVRVDFRQ